jgi:hypothetical protein
VAIRRGLPAKLALTDADDTRYLFSGLVVCKADGSPRGGVLSPTGTNLVTSSATMNVSVARFQGAAVRDGGVVLLANDGSANVLLDAAPGANSRIDVIYAKQNDSSGTVTVPDANDTPVLTFVKGTAGAVPVKPTLPVGALELATVLIPSGATATNSAGVVITQTAQFTAAAGGVIPFRTTTERDAGTYQTSQLGWLIDTAKTIYYNGTSWQGLSASSMVMVPTTATNGTVASNGTVTSSSVALVRANGVFTSAFSRYEIKFDVTTASSTGLNVLLAVAGTDTASGYDNQRRTDVNGTTTTAQSLNIGVLLLNASPLASTRHVGTLIFDTNPAAVGATYFRVECTASPNPMTTAHGRYKGSGLQRATTQFDGITFSAGAGNLTINYLSVVGSF